MPESVLTTKADRNEIWVNMFGWTYLVIFLGLFFFVDLQFVQGNHGYPVPTWPPKFDVSFLNAFEELKWIFILAVCAAGYRSNWFAKTFWFLGILVLSPFLEVPCYWLAIHVALILKLDIEAYFPGNGPPPVVKAMTVLCTGVMTWLSYFTSTQRPPSKQECPFCTKKIPARAIKCRYCHSMVF